MVLRGSWLRAHEGITMEKSGKALAREREAQMLSRMAEILDWDNIGTMKMKL